MDTVSLLKQDAQWAHELFDLVTADLTDELAHWQPPGTANSIAATYAHAICGEDGIVQMMLKGGAPLFASMWANKTGVSDPQFHSSPEWARTSKIDLSALQKYKEAVYAATNEYIASLTDSDLDAERDLTKQGLGVRTVGWCLAALVISHLHNMTGEISSLKGSQGAQGYPF